MTLAVVLTTLVLAFPKMRAFAADESQIPGGADGGRSMMMPPMTCGCPAITASEGSIYVVQGSTLYKYDAKTLSLQAKTSLSGKTGSQSQPKVPGE